MEACISGNPDGFSPEEYEEVVLCLETLLSIRKGSQPLDRDFGIDHEIVGCPVDVAKNRMSLEILEKIETYEPRVEVDTIEFKADIDGKLSPVIQFKRRELK